MAKKKRNPPKHRNILHLLADMKSGAGKHKDVSDMTSEQLIREGLEDDDREESPDSDVDTDAKQDSEQSQG